MKLTARQKLSYLEAVESLSGWRDRTVGQAILSLSFVLPSILCMALYRQH
jgi:hypothetical protein